MKSLNITEVPTFVFYAEGKEVDRYVGADRMALMNKVLAFQRSNGVKLPERARASACPPPRRRKSLAPRANAKRRPDVNLDGKSGLWNDSFISRDASLDSSEL